MAASARELVARRGGAFAPARSRRRAAPAARRPFRVVPGMTSTDAERTGNASIGDRAATV